MYESGMSILVDGTLTGSIEIRRLMQLHHVPYYNFDFSIQSLMKMMESFIRATSSAVNAVFILQDEISELLRVKE